MALFPAAELAQEDYFFVEIVNDKLSCGPEPHLSTVFHIYL